MKSSDWLTAKDATLIGDGATALKHIRAIGKDMALDPGMDNCGRPGKTWMYDAIFVREFVKRFARSRDGISMAVRLERSNLRAIASRTD